LKNLSGPSHRSAKFEKFERTLEFSDSVQNLKNLSGPSHRSAKFEKFERTLEFLKNLSGPSHRFENENFGLRKNFENLSGPSHRIRALYRGPPLLVD
jgi:hypothetical protein